MTPTLTRRDALAALAAGGLAGAGLLVADDASDEDGVATNVSLSEDDWETLVALTDVIYPAAVDAKSEFVRMYVEGLPTERRAGITESIDRLDDGARRHTGQRFASLSQDEREAVLRRMGVDTVRSDPDGTPPQRILYHLVNSLLYALYTTPKGSKLVGIENPIGHPGGYESQMVAPENDDE